MKNLLASFLIGLIILAGAGRICAEEQSKPPLEISLTSGFSELKYCSDKERQKGSCGDPVFKVVLKNTSNEPVNLQYWSCGGKEADLSFELFVEGKAKIIKPPQPACEWTEERYFTIAPKGEFIFNTNGGAWEWYGKIPKVSQPTPAWVKARYNFTIEVPKGDKRGKAFAGSDIWLWKGKIESEPLVFKIVP